MNGSSAPDPEGLFEQWNKGLSADDPDFVTAAKLDLMRLPVPEEPHPAPWNPYGDYI